MNDYITNLHAKSNNPNPNKSQHSPHRHIPIIYAAKVQYAVGTPSSPPLYSAGKLRTQQLFGSIRCYAQAVDNKLLVALSELTQKKSSPTDDTNRHILQLLD